MALKVFEKVKQKYPNATLTMVGQEKMKVTKKLFYILIKIN
jgi:hypothetical protein